MLSVAATCGVGGDTGQGWAGTAPLRLPGAPLTAGCSGPSVCSRICRASWRRSVASLYLFWSLWKPRDGGGWPGVGAATATGAGLILAGPGNLAEPSMGSTLWGLFMGPYIPSNSLTPGPVSPDLCQASNHSSSLACSWGPWCLCSDSSLPGSVPRQPARSLAHSLFAVLTAGAFPSFPILAVPSSDLLRCSMVAEGTPGSLHLHPMGPCRSCPLPWPAAALTGTPAPGC